MTLRLGYYKKNALQHMFRIAGKGGYQKATGLMRKKLDALLWSYWTKPAPV
jgi:hypothetical protein